MLSTPLITLLLQFTMENLNCLNGNSIHSALGCCSQWSPLLSNMLQPSDKINVVSPQSSSNKNVPFNHCQSKATFCVSSITPTSHNSDAQYHWNNEEEMLWVTELRIRLSVFRSSLDQLLSNREEISEDELVKLFKERLGYSGQFLLRRSVRKLFQECVYQKQGFRLVCDIHDRWRQAIAPWQYYRQYPHQYLCNNRHILLNMIDPSNASDCGYRELCVVLKGQGLNIYECWQIVGYIIEMDPHNTLESMNLISHLGLEEMESQEIESKEIESQAKTGQEIHLITTIDLSECQIEIVAQ